VPTAPIPLDPFLQDASGYHGEAEQVFVPETTQELRTLLQRCRREQVPVTLAGAGTGLTGARVPHGGAVVSLQRFRQLVVENGRARCGAGVPLSDLQAAAARTGQFFGPNPTENSASIGGIVSTNAGGARSFRYRSVRHHVLGLEVTFANAETQYFRRGDKVNFPFDIVRQPEISKNAAGYYLQPDLEWVDLLAGSEGTLGIVTEVELALLPEPLAVLSGVVFFSSDEDAVEAVEQWHSVPELRLLEYMDRNALDLLRTHYSEIPRASAAALMVEQNVTGENDAEVDLWIDRLEAVRADQDGSWFGMSAADRERFRAFRHMLPVIVTDRVRRNGYPKFSTDFAVPFSRHKELHAYYKRSCGAAFPGKFTVFGHAGDANNHVNLLPENTEEAKRGEDLIREFASAVVGMGGTVAAEHGIGKTKTDLLTLMYSEAEIASMRNVKRHLDPQWMLGQGTLFPL
jgi:FAD/FMN-containing dehydrogenase